MESTNRNKLNETHSLIWGALTNSVHLTLGMKCVVAINRSLKSESMKKRFTPDISLWNNSDNSKLVGAVDYESTNSSDSRIVRRNFENYRQYLQKTGGAYQISLITDGIPFLMWNGVKIINMQIIWDLILRADFEKDSTNHLYYLPNRVVLTVPSNIPYGTLNENDFTELESFYDILTRQNYMALGFTLDAKLLEGYMTVVAY